MKVRQTKYTPPPTAVYNAGRRKAKCSMAIRYVKELIADANEPEDLVKALEVLENHKKKLNEI